MDFNNIEGKEYQHYAGQVVRRHLSLLKKWMQQRKRVIGTVVFEPDLSRLANTENER
jgi:hypothetical protein